MPALLVDVRSPAEFATGFLGDAINMEYTIIDQLASRPGVLPDDDITLYCRSGRRSAIALQKLESLGFTNVREIGSFDEARQTLEEEGRLRGSNAEASSKAGTSGTALATAKMQDVQKSFDELLTGLAKEGNGT